MKGSIAGELLNGSLAVVAIAAGAAGAAAGVAET